MIHISSETLHQEHVNRLREKIVNRQAPLTLAPSKNPSNTVRNPLFKTKRETLAIDHLHHLLTLDPEKEIIRVEPKITFAKLTKILLSHGFMVAVVPEFSSITIGGAIMGASLESSSHRFGQVNDLCLSYEVILSDGSLITASAEENSDLFYAIPGSYGSLALLTAITMKVQKAKPYVHLTYNRYWDAPHLLDDLRGHQSDDFVEGILFSKSWAVSIVGTLVDSPKKLPINRQRKAYKRWYYQDVLKKTEKGNYEEVMPLQDYLFRLDRSAFWMGRYISTFPIMLQLLAGYQLPLIANKLRKTIAPLRAKAAPRLWLRFLFAPLFTSKALYKIWHRVPAKVTESLFFIQDFYTPLSKVESFLGKVIDTLSLYPIWLCPIKNCRQGQFLSPHYCEERMINIGLYGIPKGTIPIPLLTKKMEELLYEHGGRKMLYSYTYYDKELFSKIYDEKSYQRVREKYGASKAFPSLYEKVTHRL